MRAREAQRLSEKYAPCGVAEDTLSSGCIVVKRMLTDEDWRLIHDFVQHTDPTDIWFRFGTIGRIHEAATIKRLFDVNPDGGEMLWLFDENLAVAGIGHRGRISQIETEIALIVRSDMKRTGVGTRLLNCLIRRSIEQGCTSIIASILRENIPMLRLARKFGFESVDGNAKGLQIEVRLR